MKKLMATFALGTLLVAGFAVAQDGPADTAMDREPTVLSVGNTLF
ncbi:hypothetical protein ACFO3D_14855 [Virgibacillus kekensis]|uniref:Uncharacterized protein n=1 Tax=Virgibacillus kekensis TaxID=202261 RepID=A0ABV9DMS8_9BACI